MNKCIEWCKNFMGFLLGVTLVLMAVAAVAATPLAIVLVAITGNWWWLMLLSVTPVLGTAVSAIADITL